MKLFLLVFKGELAKSMKYRAKIITNYLFVSALIILEYCIYTGIMPDNDERILPYLLVSLSLSSCLLTYRLPKFVSTIRQGEVAKYFIYPISIWKLVVFEDLSESLVLLLENLLFIIPLFFLFGYSFYSCLLFIFSLFLSLILAVFISELFYSTTFMLHNFSAAKALLSGITSFLSGGIIPLFLFPKVFIDFCYYTPFALLVDGPARVLQNGNHKIILSQIIWLFGLAVISYISFNICVKQTEINGG